MLSRDFDGYGILQTSDIGAVRITFGISLVEQRASETMAYVNSCNLHRALNYYNRTVL